MVAQIVSGVGFLGAGTILRGTSDKIFGLTTAAMIWLCAGLGILVGMGYGPACLVVTFIVITTIEAVSQFEKKFVRKSHAGGSQEKHGLEASPDPQLTLVHGHHPKKNQETNQNSGNEEAV
jgi:uncharacterized membrane protein YhiD involved in acid resistance